MQEKFCSIILTFIKISEVKVIDMMQKWKKLKNEK